MRLLTAKGVEDEEDWGRNQALRMRGSSVPKRLSWDEPEFSVIVLVLVVGLLALAVLLVKSGLR